MTRFDDMYETAADNHGLITSSEACTVGVTNNELVRYARRGSLVRVGQGVYRLTRHVPTEADPYALAVALVGEGAFPYGEAVIALLGLAPPTTPGRMRIATTRRVRRALPDYVDVVPVHEGSSVVRYEGVPCQRAEDAIRAEHGRMPGERLAAAAHDVTGTLEFVNGDENGLELLGADGTPVGATATLVAGSDGTSRTELSYALDASGSPGET